jgi:diguanylate cyclase (GGDEF)-like protein
MVLLEGRIYPPGAERHIGLFLPSLGLGIAAALARERLERAAERDALTGIRNRRAGSAALGHALDMARSGGASIGVILVDLDHFKHVNDTLGHPVGDQVLIAAATAMASVLRADDVLARYGGEEFLVVCPGADRMALAAVGERLRAAVAGRPFVLEGGPVPITASVGGAALGEVLSGSADMLIGAADEALYAAKHGGRDRVVLAPDVASVRAA